MLRREKFQDPLNHIRKRPEGKAAADPGDSRRRKTLRDNGEEKNHVRPTKSSTSYPRFAKVRHRQLAVKWAFRRFPPIIPKVLEQKHGDTVSRDLDTLQNRISSEWRKATGNWNGTTADQLLFIKITFFDNMKQPTTFDIQVVSRRDPPLKATTFQSFWVILKAIKKLN